MERRHQEAVARLQEWIRHYGIAAEDNQGDRKLREEFTMGLLRDAGFQHVEKMPTDRHPGIFATLGRRRKAHPRHLFHVRRQAGRADRNGRSPPWRPRLVDNARCWHGGDGSRGGESEGSGVFLPRRVACDPRRQAQTAGEPGTGRGRRRGNRLTAYSDSSCLRQQCAPRSANATQC